MKLQYAIVITGGIGSGKSTVCSLLKLYGYNIIDADVISHSVLDSSSDEVVSVFGENILCDDTNYKIDRKKLGSIVFNDESKRKILESILHPKIRDEILQSATVLESGKKPYFVDIPLFFESNKKNINYDIDNVLLVYAPKKIQIERVMKRDNLAYDEALCRVESQMDIEEKKAKSTYIIENISNMANLQAQIETFLQYL